MRYIIFALLVTLFSLTWNVNLKEGSTTSPTVEVPDIPIQGYQVSQGEGGR